MKRANGEGSKPRRKINGRYEARSTLDTPTGHKRVSFYGATAKEAADKRTAAIADRNRGALFVDPGWLTVREYLERWLTDTARYQVAQSTHGRYQRTCRNHLIPFFDRIKLRDLSTAHPRVQGPQDRSRAQPQYRRRDAGRPLGSVESGCRRWAHLPEPREPR